MLGPVYRAQDETDASLVAIKALRLDVPPEQAAEVAEALVVLAAGWPVQPGLTTVLAAGFEGETPWLAMPHLAAPTLDARLREVREVNLGDTLSRVLSLAEAIDAAHARQIVHGSLHPRDVFVDDRGSTPGGSTAVTGFGIAQILTRVGIRPPVRRPYSAPEILAGDPAAPPADLFALGALTFEWLTGRRPSSLGAAAAAHFDVGDRAGALEHARTIVAAMLAERPDDRPGTAMAFAQALANALAHALDPTPATGTPVFLAPSAARPPTTGSNTTGSDTDGSSTAGSDAADSPAIGEEIERAASAHEEPPSEDALRLFAMEGTLWEAPRAAEDWRQDDEAAAAPRLGLDVTGEVDALAVSRSPDDTIVERVAEVPSTGDTLVATSNDDTVVHAGSVLGLRPPGRSPSDPAEPVEAIDGRGAAGATQSASESSAPSGVMLLLMLALGLAIGGAGGFLLGQRSAARPHEPPVVTLAPPPEEPSPVADSAAPAPPPPPASHDVPPVVNDGAPGRARALPSSGELIVRSKPAQAGVVVNNVWRGRTPLTLRGLTFGTHTVRVVERGYAPETRRVLLDARVPAATVSVQLAHGPPERAPVAPAVRPGATTGSIYIESRPSIARVFVDGRLVGTTPLLISDLPPGAHGIRLEHPGHRPWTTTVGIAAGQRERLAASLEEGSF